MLEAALDRITALVGRAFIVSALIPVVLFAGATFVALAVIENGWVVALWKLVESQKAAAGLIAILVLVAAAYLLMIISPVFKRLMEGIYDFGPISDWLEERKRRDFLRRRVEVRRSLDEAVAIRNKREEWRTSLIEANRRRREESVPSTPVGDRLVTTKADLDRVIDRGEVPTIAVLENLVRQLVSLYETDAELGQVGALHLRFSEFVEDAEGLAAVGYSRALADLQSRYAVSGRSANIQTSRIGNIMAANWSYAYTRYGVDAAFMWSRLQKVIPDTYAKVVEDSRITYDFCGAMLGLSLLYGVAGLGAPFLDGCPPDLLTWRWLIPAGGFGAALVFYLAAVEAARSFGSTLRTCFDLFRFALLEELHVELPATLKDERKLWSAINSIFVYGDTQPDLAYSHAAATKSSEPETKGLRAWLKSRLGL